MNKSHAVSDSGATGHFFLQDIPVTNIQTKQTPLVINLPDGYQLKSTHIYQLYITRITKTFKESHIVPGLSHNLLVSIKVLNYIGCKVIFDSAKNTQQHNTKQNKDTLLLKIQPEAY